MSLCLPLQRTRATRTTLALELPVFDTEPRKCYGQWRHTFRMTPPSTLAARLIGPIGAVAVLAYAVFAAVQIQVLNPLVTMSGYTLQEIHAAVVQR